MSYLATQLKRRPIDEETEPPWSRIVAARVHHLFAPRDQREIKVGVDLAAPERNGSPINEPSGLTMAVKHPPEIGPMSQPLSFMICAC